MNKLKIAGLLVLFCSFLGYSSAQTTPQLHYNFDGSCPPQDQSGNGNDGTCSGGVSTGGSGVFNDAYSFDGTDDTYVDTNTAVGSDRDLSWGLWVNMDTTNTGNNQVDLFSVEDSSNGRPRIYHEDDKGVKMSIGSDSNCFSSSVSVNAGTWYMAYTVYDASANEADFYVYNKDGSLKSNETVTGCDNSDLPNKNWNLGDQSSSQYSQHAPADLDEPRVWETELSKSEVGSLAEKNKLIGAPDINSVTTSPTDWSRNTAVDFSYGVNDSDSTVENVSLTVSNSSSGNTLKNETFNYSSSSVTDTQVDWFTPSNYGDYDVKVVAYNSEGYSAENIISKSVVEPSKTYYPDDFEDLSDWYKYNDKSALSFSKSTDSLFGDYSMKVSSDGSGSGNMNVLKDMNVQVARGDRACQYAKTDNGNVDNNGALILDFQDSERFRAIFRNGEIQASTQNYKPWNDGNSGSKYYDYSANTWYKICIGLEEGGSENLSVYDTEGNLLKSHSQDYTPATNFSNTWGVHVDGPTSTNVWVDGSPAPETQVLKPENKTYPENYVLLEVENTSEITGWKYSLDSNSNTSFYPQQNLTGLSEGTHNLKVYAENSTGVAETFEREFTVDTSNPSVSSCSLDKDVVEYLGQDHYHPEKGHNFLNCSVSDSNNVDYAYAEANYTDGFEKMREFKSDDLKNPTKVNTFTVSTPNGMKEGIDVHKINKDLWRIYLDQKSGTVAYQANSTDGINFNNVSASFDTSNSINQNTDIFEHQNGTIYANTEDDSLAQFYSNQDASLNSWNLIRNSFNPFQLRQFSPYMFTWDGTYYQIGETQNDTISTDSDGMILEGSSPTDFYDYHTSVDVSQTNPITKHGALVSGFISKDGVFHGVLDSYSDDWKGFYTNTTDLSPYPRNWSDASVISDPENSDKTRMKRIFNGVRYYGHNNGNTIYVWNVTGSVEKLNVDSSSGTPSYEFYEPPVFNDSKIQIRMCAVDDVGNENCSSTKEFSVNSTEQDSIAPNITIDSPQNQTYSSSSIDLNVTSSEAANYTYNVKYRNGTTVISNTTDNEDDQDLNVTLSGLPEDKLTVNVYGEDSAGNVGTDSVDFTVDASASITSISPVDGATDVPISSGDVTISAGYDGSSDGSVEFRIYESGSNSLYYDDTVNNVAPGGTASIQMPADYNKTYELNVYAVDDPNSGDVFGDSDNVQDINNEFTTETLSDDPPSVSLSLNSSLVQVDEVFEASATATDDFQVQNVSLDWTSDGVYDTTVSGSSLTTTHSYSNAGTYTVTARAFDNASQSSTDTAVIEVDAEDFTTNKTILESCSVSNSSEFCLENKSSPETYEGFAPEDNTTVDYNVSVPADLTGTYTFYAFANSTGVHNTYTKSNEVNVTVESNDTSTGDNNSAPTASFDANTTSPLVGEVVEFDASASSDPDGSITSYDWTFGDGTTDTGEIVTHSYGSTGDYTAELTVTDDNGSSTSVSTTISVSSDSDGGGGGGGDDGDDGGGGTLPDDNETSTGGTASLQDVNASLLAPHVGSRYYWENVSVNLGQSVTVTVEGSEQQFEVVSVNSTSLAELRINGVFDAYEEGDSFTVDNNDDVYVADIIDNVNQSTVVFSINTYPAGNNLASVPMYYNFSTSDAVNVSVEYRETGVGNDWQLVEKTQVAGNEVNRVERTGLSSLSEGIYEARVLVENGTSNDTTSPIGFIAGRAPDIEITSPNQGQTFTRPYNPRVSLPLSFKATTVNASSFGGYYIHNGELYNAAEILDGNVTSGGEDDSIIFNVLKSIGYFNFVGLFTDNPYGAFVDGFGVPGGTTFNADVEMSVPANEGQWTAYINASSNESGFTFDATSIPKTANLVITGVDNDTYREGRKNEVTSVTNNPVNNYTHINDSVNEEGDFNPGRSGNETFKQPYFWPISPSNASVKEVDDIEQLEVTLEFDMGHNGTALLNRTLVVEENGVPVSSIGLRSDKSQYTVKLNNSSISGGWDNKTYRFFTQFKNGSEVIYTTDGKANGSSRFYVRESDDPIDQINDFAKGFWQGINKFVEQAADQLGIDSGVLKMGISFVLSLAVPVYLVREYDGLMGDPEIAAFVAHVTLLGFVYLDWVPKIIGLIIVLYYIMKAAGWVKSKL